MKLILLLLAIFATSQALSIHERRILATWKTTAYSTIDTVGKCASQAAGKKYSKTVAQAVSLMKKVVKNVPFRRLGWWSSIKSWAGKTWNAAKNYACKKFAPLAANTGCPWLVSSASNAVSKKIKSKTVRKAVKGCLSKMALTQCKKVVKAACGRRELMEYHRRALLAWKATAKQVVKTVEGCAKGLVPKSKEAYVKKGIKAIYYVINKAPFRRELWGWFNKAWKSIKSGASSLYKKAKKAASSAWSSVKSYACKTLAPKILNTGCPWIVGKATKIISKRVKSKSVKKAIKKCLKKVGLKSCKDAVKTVCKRRALSAIH